MIRKYCSVSLESTGLLTCLSVSTMCLLIYTAIIIISIISITPIIILGLGQISAGQRDLILRPNNWRGLINSTQISRVTNQVTMPRFYSSMMIDDQYFSSAWFMDFDLQKENHLGALPIVEQPTDEKPSVYLHQQYNYKVGRTVELSFRDYKIFKALHYQLQTQDIQNKHQILKSLNLLKNKNAKVGGQFEVRGVYDLAMGKFPAGSQSGTLYLNITSAFQYIVRQTYKRERISNDAFVKYCDSISMGDFATQLTINIPNRIEVYKNSDYQETYTTLSEFGMRILEKCGLFSVRSEIPIAKNLIKMSYLGMFIGVILKLIIFSLFCLSVLMMNNMLNVGIQKKSFDFALLKTMGANRSYVVFTLLVDSVKYVIIANIIAFPFAYISLYSMSAIFQQFFGYVYYIQPSPEAIIGGLFIGVLVPIVASIFPIWGVINNDLTENLNPIRNKTESIKTQIYIEGTQFPIGKLIYGGLSLSFGLMIYYLLPKSMINQDISLLLFVFFTILVGLLIGLIMISYSFQYLFERLIAYATLFWANKTDFILMMKNLSAHRIKNRKTSLLYALSVSLVIFVSVGISIQIQTIEEEFLKSHGTFIEIRTSEASKQYYDNLFKTKFKDQIIDWAYQTLSLQDYLSRKAKVKNIFLSDQAKLFLTGSKIYGVSPNYLKVMANQQTMPITKSFAFEPYDPYQFLYTPEGYMTCTIGQYTAKKFGLINTKNRQFLISLYTDSSIETKALNVSTIFSKRAGLGYSSFGFGRHQVGVSFDTYATLAGLSSYQEIPFSKIKIKVKDPLKIKKLANSLRNSLKPKNGDSVWDYNEVKQKINEIKDLLDNILEILLTLVLLISFFSLVTTSYINIINQHRQIGILMILGYSKVRILKIFVYQSFVLIVNSCLIGILVGMSVAWMMGLQRELFGDYPIGIQINGLWIIGLAAVVSSFLSTIQPIYRIFKKTINSIIIS